METTKATKNHRIEAYFKGDRAYCAKCEKPLQQTGKGNGWTHTA